MRSIIYILRQLYAFTGLRLVGNFIGMLAVGLLESFMIMLLIPLVGITGVLGSASEHTKLGGFLQAASRWEPRNGLLAVLGIYVMIIVLQSIVKKRLAVQDARLHTRFINHLRLDTYRSIMQARWSFFVKHRKTDLIHALTNELGQVTSGIQIFLQLMNGLVFTLIQLALVLWLSAKVTAFVLACGLLLLVCSRTFIYKSKAVGSNLMDMAKEYLSGITDHFNGIKDIKSNHLEEPRYRWLSLWSERVETERVKQVGLASQSQLLYKSVSAILLAGFVYAGFTWFHSEKETLLLIVVIFSRLWPQFSTIQSNMESLASVLPSFHRLIELQRECKEEREVVPSDHAVGPMEMKNEIRLEQVAYQYQSDSQHYALQNISLRIPVRQMTAIVGKSGAGKSTLIDLLLGLLKPQSGVITVDGQELQSSQLPEFRKMVSYVAQDPFLFNASIRDNLLLTAPSATEEELWDALRFASVDDLVRTLPDQLDTFIGDRGVKLSGGERQRLVLARAILKQPSILLLDEATSALDTENEARIQRAIERLKGRMTVVVIAHRLSTIRHADSIVVLNQGQVEQMGTFDELAARPGLFRELLRNQELPVRQDLQFADFVENSNY